jgi:phosphohistidine phosphatase
MDTLTIYVLRHGIAQPRRRGFPDEDRALTREGKLRLSQVLALARAAKVAPSVIITSPYRRAVETAAMAAASLGCKKTVSTAALAPASTPEAVWNEIRSRHNNEKAVLLAGHEPLLGQTIAYLLGAPRLSVDLKKGALARIDFEQVNLRPHGALEWLLTPRLAAAARARHT